jgi:glycosyltransferase involved in cell wall biosynthesis
MAGPLTIAYSFPFRLGRPGIGAAALSQIKALAGQGCLVDVYCWSAPEPVPGVNLFQTRSLAPVPQRMLGIERACRLHDHLTSDMLKRSQRDFDLVHTWPLAAESTLRTARSRNWLAVREAPNTHTAHAFEVVAKEHRALGLPQVRDHSHTFRRSVLDRELREYESADLILAPSALAVETFVRNGVERSKLAEKSYGFDPAEYRSTACRKARDVVTFSFVARCEPRKGLHLALEAWRRSGIADRSRFQITGRFTPGYRRRIAALLDHVNVSEQGFVADLKPVYASADVLVLPSVEEGSALVTYEAQASGCALLVSEAAGARFTHGVEGFEHAVGDIDTLAEQMRILVDDPARLYSMQGAAAVNAQQYTWARATEDLINAYETALARQSP